MVRLTVRNRIFIMIIGVGTVIFALLLAAVYTHTTKAFKDSIGEGLHRVADQLALRIDLSLMREIDKSMVLSRNEALVSAVEKANHRYDGLSAAEAQKAIDSIDNNWPYDDRYRNLYTPSLNPTAELLSKHKALYPDKIAELFMTDVYGGLIASTNKTSDYGQADEAWWQVAYNDGKGAAGMGIFEFDESAQVYAFTIATPIMDSAGTRAIGVLKAVINIHKLLELLAGYKLGETGHIHLVDSEGVDVFPHGNISKRPPHVLKPGIAQDILHLSKHHTVVTDENKKKLIVGFAPVPASETFGLETLSGRKWYVLVFQELGEAYVPVYRLMKTLLALGLVALVALYLTVLLTAGTITKPLYKLRRGTQRVRDGDLEQRVELLTGDELQELAESFNEMTGKLQVSYDELRNRTNELERSLDALGQSEERYKSVLETSRSGIVVCDDAGRFPIYNPSFAEMLGYSIHEMKEVKLSDFVHPDDLSMVEQQRRAYLSGRYEAINFEVRCLTKAGEEIIAEVSQGHYAPAGKVVGVIWELRDITKQKRAQEGLKAAHEELKIAYETLEKAQAVAIVSEKMAALGRLTAGVSHEVLNPLNIITMRLHLMLNNPDTPPEIARPLKVLDEQAQRISKIIKELLYFARQRPPDRQPTDLNDALSRTLSLVEPDFRLSNIDLELRLDEKLPLVSLDRDQLQQVMLNLLSNAQEAMPGGGRLSLCTDTVQTIGKRWVELRVEDTGEGIDPAHHDKIFEPFFTTKPEGEGNGLGLAICKGIIDSHGGAMWAENNPNGGASFVVRLEVDSGDRD